jgi:hypothetical protein
MLGENVLWTKAAIFGVILFGVSSFLANGLRFSRRADAGTSRCYKINRTARVAAGLRAR